MSRYDVDIRDKILLALGLIGIFTFFCCLIYGIAIIALLGSLLK